MASHCEPQFDAKGQPIPEDQKRLSELLFQTLAPEHPAVPLPLRPKAAQLLFQPAGPQTSRARNAHLVFGDTGGPKQPDADKLGEPAPAAKEPGRFVAPEPSMDNSAPNSAERK